MDAEGIGIRAMSRLSGVSFSAVQRAYHGGVVSAANASALARATGLVVTSASMQGIGAEDLVSLPYRPSRTPVQRGRRRKK